MGIWLLIRPIKDVYNMFYWVAFRIILISMYRRVRNIMRVDCEESQR
jgi:hypothetical protein